MDLSLKKARKLETKIGAFVAQNSSNVETTFDARVNSTKEEIDKQAVEARTKFFENVKNVEDLNNIRYEIRRLISDANAVGGEKSIDFLLNEKVVLESKLARLNALLRFQKYDPLLMEDQLNSNKKLLESGADRYGRSNVTFDVNFLTSVDEQKFKDDKVLLAKKIEEIEDKLAELNYSKRISLGANSVKLLQDNGLV
jgi:hypothetical protein